jgi:hypothetical protein
MKFAQKAKILNLGAWILFIDFIFVCEIRLAMIP